MSELVFEEEWRQREPLTSADCDLRGLDGFMLNVERLMASELWAKSTPSEFKAAVGLWCKAWKQVPAASLPDDDAALASFAGSPRHWAQVRTMALRGFVKCSDGRLYHKVLAADANRAWVKRQEYRDRTRGATEARKRKRGATKPGFLNPKVESHFGSEMGLNTIPTQQQNGGTNTNEINEGHERDVERHDQRNDNVDDNVTLSQGQRHRQNPHNPPVVTLTKKANGAAAPAASAWSEFAELYVPTRTRSVVKAMVAFQDACAEFSQAVVLEATKVYAKDNQPEYRVAPEKFFAEILPGLADTAKKEIARLAARVVIAHDIEIAWGKYAEPLFRSIGKEMAITYFENTTLEPMPDESTRIHFTNGPRTRVAENKFRAQLERILPAPVIFLEPQKGTSHELE